MVGLVIVSHSRILAEGVCALAAGVSDVAIPIAGTGGVGSEGEELGTDVTRIVEAIRQVDSPAGVLVLADLGSALLGAETAMELLGTTLAGPVRLSRAPLVEGAVSAAVQASLGGDLDSVAGEAERALAAKREEPEEDEPEENQMDARPARESRPTREDWHTGTFRVTTRHGLHARPAVRLVQTAARYDARGEIRSTREGRPWVSVRSLNRVIMLQIRSGEEFDIRFSGGEASDALDAVAELVGVNFGERPEFQELPRQPGPAVAPASGYGPESRPAWTRRIRGMPASAGIALAPVAVLRAPHPRFEGGETSDDVSFRPVPLDPRRVRRDLSRLREAIHTLAADIRLEAQGAYRAGFQDTGDIGEAHAGILEDPDLLAAAGSIYSACEIEPLEAFWRAAESISREYRLVEDSYVRARGLDVIDVAVRLVAHLDPQSIPDYSLPATPVILVADELLPSCTMNLDRESVRGIITTGGSPSSHASLIVRGLGIPMITGAELPSDWTNTLEGREIILDGYTGEIDLAPDGESRRMVLARMEEENERRVALRTIARGPAATRDGSPVLVEANIATLADAREAVVNGADGVGVLRTEYLFLGRRSVPGEEEQLATLREMTAPFESMPVTVRLLDIGGDKEVASLRLPRESNPFLGLRGIRLLLHPGFESLLHSHLRAVLRLARDRDARIMLPMVTLIREITELRARLQEARKTLVRDGTPHRWPLDVGIMVETPAAALDAGRLAREVDFFSIGTNDLTQYVMAAERGNEALAAFENALHPAVLAAVRSAIEGAEGAGIPLSVCGEIGSDPRALPVLIGLGVRRLSVNAAAVIAVKEQVRTLGEGECLARARGAISGDST